MYIELNIDEMEIISRVEMVVGVEFEKRGNYIGVDKKSLIGVLQDLVSIIDEQEEQIDNLSFENSKLEGEIHDLKCDHNPEIEVPEIHGEGISW